MKGVQTVFNAATLHKPHIATHSRQEFVDTNIIGTLNLLEATATEGVETLYPLCPPFLAVRLASLRGGDGLPLDLVGTARVLAGFHSGLHQAFWVRIISRIGENG